MDRHLSKSQAKSIQLQNFQMKKLSSQREAPKFSIHLKNKMKNALKIQYCLGQRFIHVLGNIMAQNFLNHVCFCTQHWIFIFVLLHLFGLYSRRDLLTNSELPLLIKDHHLLLIYLHLADSSFNCLAVVLPLFSLF